MKKIEKESDMITTFSKRKYGIYKKVNELITLTGSEVGFLVFSPAGKSFTFSQPSFKDLALRYLGRQKKQPQLSPDNGEMFRQARIQELNQTYNMLLELVEEEEKKDVALRQKLKGKQLNNWWNKTVEKVEVGELSDLESAYSELLMKVEKRRMKLVSPRNDMNGCVSTSSSHFLCTLTINASSDG
ncbi:unnamed protein product [Linum tenue]|uniref:MADS-box domain-containing protein n=1 Tax=Linum tenue TaxID=586396 RepID=A0AAV0HXA3_9ROSI|nr:unnamed protein product [Linum tenue]